MIIKFPIAAFAEAAKAVRKLPSASNDIEIFDHARLDVTKTSMAMTMSDMDIEARATIDCEAEKKCVVAIPRAVLEFFIAREGSGDAQGTLDFDDELKHVTARHGKARLTMQILLGSDFHLLEFEKPEWTMVLRAHELCGLFKRCEKACSVDVNRWFLSGPFVHQVDGALRAIGADGSRIHLFDFDEPDFSGTLPSRAETMPGIIVPARAIKEIQRIFAGDESEVTLSGTSRMIVVEAKRLRIASKLIDGTYIDYPRMMPKRPSERVVVAVDALNRAIDGLLVVPKRDAKGKSETSRTIRITMQDASISLFTRGDLGDADDVVDATNEGVAAGTEISFNAQFLRDVIEAAGAKQIAIHPPAEIGLPFHVSGGEGATFVIGQRRM